MVHLRTCAMINGLSSDSGPCDIGGLPLGLFLVAFTIILAVLVGRAMARRL